MRLKSPVGRNLARTASAAVLAVCFLCVVPSMSKASLRIGGRFLPAGQLRPKAPADPSQEQIQAIYVSFDRFLVTGDFDRLGDLLADDFTYVSDSGKVMDKNGYLSLIKGNNAQYPYLQSKSDIGFFQHTPGSITAYARVRFAWNMKNYGTGSNIDDDTWEHTPSGWKMKKLVRTKNK